MQHFHNLSIFISSPTIKRFLCQLLFTPLGKAMKYTSTFKRHIKDLVDYLGKSIQEWTK